MIILHSLSSHFLSLLFPFFSDPSTFSLTCFSSPSSPPLPSILLPFSLRLPLYPSPPSHLSLALSLYLLSSSSSSSFPSQLILEYETRAKQLREQVQAFELLREMEGKIEELEKELQWALVIEIENVRAVYSQDTISMLWGTC